MTAKLYDITVTPESVREKLTKLHLNKACGRDGWYVNVMKCVPDFDVPLSSTFTKSLLTGSA